MQIITKGEIGGAQTHVLALCQALAERVSLVATIGGPSSKSFLAIELQALGVPVGSLEALGNSLSPWRTIRAVRSLLRLVRQHRPDILHAHSAVAGVVARIAGRIAGTPVIYTVHGFGFKPEVPRLQRWAAWTAEWTLARVTDHMICVSDHEKLLAQRLPIDPGRVTVVRNALPDSADRAEPGRTPVRVIMVARFAHPKRYDVLLRALAALRKTLGYEVPASLVGSGPDSESLRELARQLGLQFVHFTGDVDDVPGRLANHEVFTLISDHEGLPISIIEAMRAGLAIVASNLSGIRELLVDRKQGLLVSNDPEVLADALACLVLDPSLRMRLGDAARRQYESCCTAAPMAAAVEAVYGQIARHALARHHSR